MPDIDPLADLKNLHPILIDLSRVPDRAFTAEEKTAILDAAQKARTSHEWLASVVKIVWTLAKALPALALIFCS